MMKAILICAVALFQGLSAPAVCAQNLTPPTEQDFEKWESNGFAGSPYERQALIEEAKLIAAHPELAQRDGQSLTIFHNRKPIAVYTAGGKSGMCDSYILNKVVRLRASDTAVLDDYAEVVCFRGEFDMPFLVLTGGTPWYVRSVSASPGGTMIASGTEAYGNEDTAKLTLYTWPALTAVARFDAGCRGLGWRDDRHFDAICNYDPTPRPDGAPFDIIKDNDNLYFYAQVWLDDTGAWQLQAVKDALQEAAEEVEIWRGPPFMVDEDMAAKASHVRLTAKAMPPG